MIFKRHKYQALNGRKWNPKNTREVKIHADERKRFRDWIIKAEQITLKCYNDSIVVIEVDGTEYAVNGLAQSWCSNIKRFEQSLLIRSNEKESSITQFLIDKAFTL